MSTPKPKVLIVAPHIDDEMIGCWSVLSRSFAGDIDLTVLYLHDLFEKRMAEAIAASEAFKFRPVFNIYAGQEVLNAVVHTAAEGGYTEVYVPSRRDWHADHQQVNREYRKWATHFYSVDMAHGSVLATCRAKYNALEDFYPSQATLWRGNDKYWLFEDIQETDYDEYKTLTWSQPTGFDFSVTVLANHVKAVVDWYDTSRRANQKPRAQQFLHDRRPCIDSLLEVCSGRVIVEYMGYIIEA